MTEAVVGFSSIPIPIPNREPPQPSSDEGVRVPDDVAVNTCAPAAIAGQARVSVLLHDD
jgi:hypothetical protein